MFFKELLAKNFVQLCMLCSVSLTISRDAPSHPAFLQVFFSNSIFAATV